MERCFRCGASSDSTVLYDAIADEGIVKVCERCRMRENFPVIKRVSPNTEPEKILTVRERLSYMTGVSPKEKEERTRKEIEEIKKQSEELRRVMEKNFREKLGDSDSKADVSGESGMIRNFHWTIMRARRAKHLTQKELADMISEPEIAIRMAEQGTLPREREKLVKKIQNALNIQITKIPYGTYTKLPEQEKKIQSSESGAEIPKEGEEIDFKSKEKRWTIGDLLGIKKRLNAKEKKITISEALEEDTKGDPKEE